jgi:GNAT superfamily N-acetyltransferase
MRELVFRPYVAADYAACLAVFDSNTPPYFDASERAPFAQWLVNKGAGLLVYENASLDYYEVALLGDEIVGCAGYYIVSGESVARMAWGMVHKDYHKQGIGSAHLKHRIQLMQNLFPGYTIDLGTSQLTYAFYERHGFVVTQFFANGYGEGIDRYEMVLQLT